METQTFVRQEVRKNTGCLIYEGPSLLNGAPIIAVLTYGSNNEKTGGMHQLWILSRDVAPVEATHTGADDAICGDCPHRGEANGEKAVNRSCYVKVFQAPNAIWKKYQRGGYPRAAHAEVEQLCSENAKGVRLGAYGDPAALPVSLLETLTRRAQMWTGYTHAWKKGIAIQEFCMASADSVEEAERAVSEGWRTFLVTPKGAGLRAKRVSSSAMICPASHEMGQTLTCDRCGACSGHGSRHKAKIVQIEAHGPLAGNIEKRRILGNTIIQAKNTNNLVAASSLVR